MKMLRALLFNMRMSLRIWLRNRTRPLTIEEAEEKKLFWSKVYMTCGVLTFLLITTNTLMDPSEKEFSKSLPVHRKLIEKMDDKEKIRVIKYSGFTKTSDVVMTKKDALQLRDSEMETLKNDSKEIN